MLRVLHAKQCTSMNQNTKVKTAYWIFTILLVLPLLGSGVGFCIAPPPVVSGITHLGYPAYLIPFLGIAKLLGVAAILAGRFPKVKEWAYAGFVFDLIGAAYSHIRSGDRAEALAPLVILSFAVLSYLFWKRLGSIGKTSSDMELAK